MEVDALGEPSLRAYTNTFKFGNLGQWQIFKLGKIVGSVVRK